MKVVIQRVTRASVRVEGREVASIGCGLLLLAAVEKHDDEQAVLSAARKIASLRIFPVDRGANERMDRSVLDAGGAILLVSQFTLAGSIHKGRRPSFDGAAPPPRAEELYEKLAAALRAEGAEVATGMFRAMMEVELVNDGPVTFILETGR